MKKNLKDKKDNPASETIIIPDECGDTMWDAVLEQDVMTSQTNSSKRSDALLKEIHALRTPSDSETRVKQIFQSIN